jgi:hypothetical protein
MIALWERVVGCGPELCARKLMIMLVGGSVTTRSVGAGM